MPQDKSSRASTPHLNTSMNLKKASSVPPKKNIMVVDVTSQDHFTQTAAGDRVFVVHFWADWAGACKQIDVVLQKLEGDCPNIGFLRVRSFCHTTMPVNFFELDLFFFFFVVIPTSHSWKGGCGSNT